MRKIIFWSVLMTMPLGLWAAGHIPGHGADKMTARAVVQSLPEGDIRLYPNPAHGVVHIQTAKDIKPLRIALYDLTGKQLLNKAFPADGKLSLQGLKPGIYLLRIQTERRTVTFKLSVY